MRRALIILCALLFTTSACQSSAIKTISNTSFTDDSKTLSSGDYQYTGIKTQAPQAYQVMFIIEFSGSKYEWEYQLTTRNNENFTEYTFYLEGIDSNLNPGAVRVVTNGLDSWMSGAGTNENCFRFPNSLDLGPVFLSPDNFFDPEFVQQHLVDTGQEIVLEQNTTHFSVKDGQYLDWTEVSIDIWATETGAILKYLGNAMVEDPLYDAGYGFFNFSYIVSEIGDQTIEPILGCEVDYPLPENTQNLVIFPGLISFESLEDRQSLVAFYQQSMQANAWIYQGEQNGNEETIILDFQKDGQQVLIAISTEKAHSFVEIIED